MKQQIAPRQPWQGEAKGKGDTKGKGRTTGSSNALDGSQSAICCSMENRSLWSGSPFAGRFLFLFADNGICHAPPWKRCGGPAFFSDCGHSGKDKNVKAVSTIAGAAAQVFGDYPFQSISLFAGEWPHLAIQRTFLSTVLYKAFGSLWAWTIWFLTVQYLPWRGDSCVCGFPRFTLCDPTRAMERYSHQSHLFGWCSRHWWSSLLPLPFPTASHCLPPGGLFSSSSAKGFSWADWDWDVGCFPLRWWQLSACGQDGNSFLGSLLAAKSVRDTQSRLIARLLAEK